MTPDETRTKIDTVLANLWPKMVNRQRTYAANHNGRYWQGLLTHRVMPVDGADAAPDMLDSKPTDQTGTWRQALGIDLPSLLPMALRVDVYDGPEGAGFVATAYVKIGADTFTRSQNYGPEKWRTQPWTMVQETAFSPLSGVSEASTGMSMKTKVAIAVSAGAGALAAAATYGAQAVDILRPLFGG